MVAMLWARDAERAAVDRLLASARSGQGGALLICGEPGIGKSALLEYAPGGAGDMVALSWSAAESETTLAYAGLHHLLRPLMGRVGGLPEPQARAIRIALGLESGVGPDRFLVSLATLTLLSESASDRPILWVLDDAHWADLPTLEVIAFLARRLEADPIALLAASRDCAGQPWATGMARLSLDGLPPEAAAALLAQRWGADLVPPVREALVGVAAGNPLALIELPRLLSPEERSGRRPLPDPLPVAAGLERVFLARVRLLGPELRLLALLCAAETSGSVVAICRAAQAMAVDDPVRRLPELADLVRVEGAMVAFHHPLMRSAIYHGSDPGERRAAHRALADALATEESQADRRAWHQAQAATGPDEGAAVALECSAERAVRRSGHAAASISLERAADLSSTDEGRARRLVGAADTAWRGGDSPRTRTLLERAERLEPRHPPVRLRMRYLQGLVELRAGIPADGLAILLDAASEAVRVLPSLAIRILTSANEAAFEVADHEAMQRLRALMAEVPEPDDPTDALLRRLYLAVTPRTRGETPQRVHEDLAWVERLDDPDLLIRVGGMAFGLGEDATARRMRSKASAQARRLGAAGMLAWTIRAQAMDETVRGRYAWAEACAAEGLQLAQETGQPNLACRHLIALAEVAALRGQADEGRRLAEAALGEASGRGLVGTAALACRALGLLELALGNPREALVRFDALWRLGPGVRGVAVLAVPDVVEAAVRVGHPELARERLPELLAWARAGSAEARALNARARALLAAGEEAEREFQEAMVAHEVVDRPLDAARTWLLYGEYLRRERRRADARQLLRRALEAFERLGTALWAGRARGELRATGETTRRRDPATLDLLTRQELQVVRAVTEGATNREAAAQLFISPRTVDHHLRNVFQKLGVRSRAELVRVALAGHGIERTGPADAHPGGGSRR
jgi:DNA-binding CsgD family transcriptional regulator